jgi:hypothetical protein
MNNYKIKIAENTRLKEVTEVKNTTGMELYAEGREPSA